MQFAAKILITVVFFISTCGVTPEDGSQVKLYEVVGVSDGDTLTILLEPEKKEQKIRLATIDAPEYRQAFGRRSRQNLADLVFRKRVSYKEISRDRYGRIIAEVFVGDRNINVEQIRSGFAWHYKRHERQQTFAERAVYSQAEDYAKENRLGIWQVDNPVPPWVYRRRNPRRD